MSVGAAHGAKALVLPLTRCRDGQVRADFCGAPCPPGCVSVSVQRRNRRRGAGPASRTESRLLAFLSARRHSTQCRWTGDVRSTIWWQRAHSTLGTTDAEILSPAVADPERSRQFATESAAEAQDAATARPLAQQAETEARDRYHEAEREARERHGGKRP